MSRRNERGTMMVSALLALLFAASMVALVLERADGLRAATDADATELRAQYAAEGGLAHARWALVKDPAWRGETMEIGGVAVTVSVEDDRVVAVAAPGSVRIERPLPRR
ncbi:MAG: hypothetical protein ACYTGZ_09345 [Planctomycetota bacterium]|jgi:type II secretory pathway component PulK